VVRRRALLRETRLLPHDCPRVCPFCSTQQPPTPPHACSPGPHTTSLPPTFTADSASARILSLVSPPVSPPASSQGHRARIIASLLDCIACAKRQAHGITAACRGGAARWRWRQRTRRRGSTAVAVSSTYPVTGMREQSSSCRGQGAGGGGAKTVLCIRPAWGVR
jgi:hypothetical protein